jgi:G:T/U-mismatch repair DNA glycosylase
VPTALTLERVPLHKQIYARALLDMGTSTRSVASECSIGLSTVQAIKQKQDYSDKFLEAVKRKLPTAFYALGGLAMSKVSDEKLDVCSAPQLMMVAGIAVDKARDMEGNNRPIVNIVTMVGDLTARLNDIKTRQAALMELGQ